MTDAEVAALADRLRAAPPRAGRTRVLAIDGRSGAGKTSLGAALGARLGAPVLQLEPLYPGWDGLERGIDLLAEQVLAPIAAGRPARVPRWDWFGGGGWLEPWTLPPPSVLVVEGVGAGARRAARHASLLVWVELSDEQRLRRALERDGDGYLEFWDRWAAQETAMLARERTPDRADLVIDTGGGERGRDTTS